MDEKIFWAIVVAVFTIAIFALMWWGWRSRSRRTQDYSRYAFPDQPGDPLAVYELAYVATTKRNDPLERITSAGLAFRGSAQLVRLASGWVLQIQGASDFYLPQGIIEGAERATWTIDRVVEPGGLIKVLWKWHDLDLDSFFRANSPELAEEVVQAFGTIAEGEPAGE